MSQEALLMMVFEFGRKRKQLGTNETRGKSTTLNHGSLLPEALTSKMASGSNRPKIDLMMEFALHRETAQTMIILQQDVPKIDPARMTFGSNLQETTLLMAVCEVKMAANDVPQNTRSSKFPGKGVRNTSGHLHLRVNEPALMEAANSILTMKRWKNSPG
jgi:hypothetical protein